MPTLQFLFYLAAIGFAYLFRLSYLGWFGPYLLAVVIFVPILLLLLSLPSMLGMTLQLQAPLYCSRKSDSVLTLRFSSARFLPLSHVRVHLSIENLYTGERKTETHSFQSVTTGRADIALPTALCGVLRCRVTRWECRDLLGLFALRRRELPELLCTVLPEAIPPEQPLDLEAALQSAARYRPKYGGGFSEEHELREYRPGDTVNSIHWKLSAKTDAVIVREALVRENQEIFLVLLQVGAEDRGLEVLSWLSQSLCRMELAHILVADRLYPAANEQEGLEALRALLSAPLGQLCAYDASRARCVFLISGGEVRLA